MNSRNMRVDPNSSNATSNGARSHLNGSPLSTMHKAGASKSMNGHSATANGFPTYTNGSVIRGKPLNFYGHDREEVTRLLIQGLGDLGYHEAANRLSQESGYEVESPSVAAFRHAVLQGEWSEAESLLFGSYTSDEGGGVSISNGDPHYHQGLTLAQSADRDELKFKMREQKYLELLEERDLGNALMVLRQELTPLHQDTGKLHSLSRFEPAPRIAYPDL